MKAIERFLKDESGLETVEYAIVAAVLVVGIIATLILVKNGVINAFTKVSTELNK